MGRHELAVVELAQEGFGAPLIAKKLGVNIKTVYAALRKAGIVADGNKAHPCLPIEEIERLYELGLPAAEIAAGAGVSPQTILRCLRAHGVHIRHIGDYLRGKQLPRRIHIDETCLRGLVSEGMTCGEMGDVFGCNAEVVRMRMIELGIARLPAKARMKHNYFWQGGRTIDSDGYILVKVPNHPYATSSGYVREHRLVMEQKLGRYLLPSEVVDHKDNNHANNTPENLRLFASNVDHLRATLKGRVPCWTEDGRQRIRAAQAHRKQGNPQRQVGEVAASPLESGNDVGVSL